MVGIPISQHTAFSLPRHKGFLVAFSSHQRPQRIVRGAVQFITYTCKVRGVQIIFTHPQAALDVVHKQIPQSCGVAHGYIVSVTDIAGGSIVVFHIAQSIAYALRETALIYADIGAGFIKQSFIDYLQALCAAALYASAYSLSDLMCTYRGDGHAVDAVFLKEHRIAEVVNRASPFAVRAYRCSPAIGRKAHVLSPVLEITKSTAVNLIESLAIDNAVLASPESVLCLDDIVHVGHSSCQSYKAGGLGDGCIDDTYNNDIVLYICTATDGVDNLIPVYIGIGSGNLDAVIFFEQFGNLAVGDETHLGIDGGNRHPLGCGCAPLFKCVLIL